MADDQTNMPAPDPDNVYPPAAVLLIEPRDGLPEVVASDAALERAAEALASGYGPVAVDAERASGYRYGQSAYLVQLRRAGSGTVLIDPLPCPDMSSINDAIHDAEWVLHAANQDLECLAGCGLHPASLFDTELAGRLAGFPRVALGTMVETLLGYHLQKSHSAADWSRRPLPPDWIRYAALDVEVLVDLRDALEILLQQQGKLGWAREEFEAVRTAPPSPPRVDPWRRVSGMHKIHDRRAMATVRSLWQARDRIAQERDIAPGRLLPDASIITAATMLPRPTSRGQLAGLAAFTGRGSRRYLGAWWDALAEAAALPDGELPAPKRHGDGPPPTNRWREREPAAAARLAAGRATVGAIAERIGMPVENLLPPDALRRLAWQPPEALTTHSVGEALRDHAARGWQVELTAVALVGALSAAPNGSAPSGSAPTG